MRASTICQRALRGGSRRKYDDSFIHFSKLSGRVPMQYDSPTAVDGLDVCLDGCGNLAAQYDERLQ